MSDVPTTGISLVLGPANSGKLGRVLRWWEERQPLQPLIVVPTAPDARSLSAEMAQRRGALVGQSPATTFDGLVRLLVGKSPRYVGDFERSLLISHLLREQPPQAPGLSARFPGTPGVVASLIKQLGDSGRSAEELQEALGRWAATDGASAALAADITRLLAGYSSLRDQLGLSDRSDGLRAALAAAKGWTRPLALYGFTSFTLAQRGLLAALARVTEVLLVLDYERAGGRGLTTPAEMAWWERLAGRVEEFAPVATNYTSPAIARLERHFMDDAGPAECPQAWIGGEGGGVRFLLASGQRNEAELAAEQVAGLVRDGIDPGEIAVVVRSTKTWGRLLDDVFASCGIPCEVDEQVALGETGLGYAFLSGLRGLAHNDPAAVTAYLRSPYSALTPEQAADVELRYLRGTTRGVRALTRCADDVAEGALRHPDAAVIRRDEAALVDLDAVRGLAARMLRNSLAGFAAAGDDAAGGGEAARHAGSDARVLRALDGALAALAVYRREGRLPEGILRADVLLPALARLGVTGAPTGSAGAVQVLTAHRARARRFQAVLILGLVEGEFPHRGDRPSLLTAAQRARLDASGGGLFPPEVSAEEPLFVRAVSRAWKFLLLSSRDADDGGAFAGRSYYWSHCRALLQVDDADVVRRTLGDQVFRPDQAPSLRQYLRTCAADRLEPHPSCRFGPLDAPAWRRAGALAGLESPRVLEELSQTSCFSPSALESYLKCPFAWFVQRVIGAEDMEAVVDGRLTGELLHRVLRDTVRRLKAAEALPLRQEHLQMAEDIAAALVEASVDSEECPGSSADRRLMAWRLKRMAAEVFAMEVAASSPLEPVETELTVGGDAGVDVGGIVISGRIDRVDRSRAGGAFIIDYKSGSVPPKGKIGSEEALQIPLYMLALARDWPETKVIGGAYLSPKEAKRSGVVEAGSEDLLGDASGSCTVADKDALRAILDGSIALAKQAAGGIRCAEIAPLTGRKCPGWCGLGPVCRARVGTRRW